LSSGEPGNSTSVRRATFATTVGATSIRSIRILHDGNPRSGHPFDTYDNWDLRTLGVSLANASFLPTTGLYDSVRDSSVGALVNRFTGSSRQIEIPIRAIGCEPDLTILAMSRTSTGLDVRVRNIGLCTGRLTQLDCSAFGRYLVVPVNLALAVGGTRTLRIPFLAAGTVTCSVRGVDLAGRPEVVTANNVRVQTF
jgi:hypothetical protein